MDRIDLHLNVPAVDVNKLMGFQKDGAEGERSKSVNERVMEARKIQTTRLGHLGLHCNADMKNRHIKQFAKLTTEANLLLKQAVNKYALSARTYFRLIKVARTIADLTKSENIEEAHVAEALQYRVRDNE